MKPIWKILAVGCLCVSFAGSVTAYADVEVGVSPHMVAPVRATGDYSNIAVSQVTDYVNIREEANTDSTIVGKIYNNCAATILETVQGEGGDWYRIQSGTVTGYIKAQYFITGEDAEKLAQSIGREFVTVNAEGLRLREQPDLNSEILTLLSNGARYVVQGEEGDFFKVEVDADLTGYIAKEYCQTEVEFDQAVSLEEERQKLEEEEQRRQEAQEAMEALQQVIMVEANNAAAGNGAEAGAGTGGAPTLGELIIAANPLGNDTSHNTTAPQLPAGTPAEGAGQDGGTSGAAQGNGTGGESSTTIVAANPNSSSQPSSGQAGPASGSAAVVSATRTAIVAYAKQFLGNPYVYGGTSLTNGTDCSGFTQGVYAHFGITTGRTSRDQAANGREIAVSSAQPGDLLFYASGNYINHVAMYIGDGKVIHASTPTTGITIAPYDYRTPYKAVTFLD